MRYLKIFIFAILFIFICSKPTYADTFIKLPDVPVLENREDYMLYRYPSGDDYIYRLLVFSADELFFNSSTDTMNFYYNNVATCRYNYDSETNNWVYDSSYGEQVRDVYSWNAYNCEILYCTVNVYDISNNNSLFFQATPMSTTTFSGISGGQILNQIMKILLGLAKSLILFLISVIGFRKAWNWLKIQLLT